MPATAVSARRPTGFRPRCVEHNTARLRRFIARQTGTIYHPPVDEFDPKHPILPEPVAQSTSDRGLMPFSVAAEQAEQDLAELARRPDIEPDQGDFVEDVNGERISSFRLSMIQRMARSVFVTGEKREGEPRP